MDIIRDIERSIGIKKFIEESENDYRKRLYYSAIGHWIQELVKMTNNFYDEDIVDKLYLMTHLRDKVIYLYKILKIDNQWMQESEILEFLDNLIDIKIDIFNLIINKENKIYIEDMKIKFDDILISREKAKLDDKLISMGYLEEYSNKSKYIDIEGQIIENETFIDSVLKMKLPDAWICFSIDYCDLKLFIPNETGIFDKSWTDIDITNNSMGRYLGMDKNSNYYILDLIKDTIFLIDEYYIFEGEIYRLMYHIYSLSSFKINLDISDMGEYYIIHIANKLPNIESRFIQNIGWPKLKYNNYEDIIFSRESFYLIEKIFNGLGVTFINDKKKIIYNMKDIIEDYKKPYKTEQLSLF